MEGSAAGYSGTPLPKKLGIKEDHTVALVGAPDHIEATLGELPDGVDIAHGGRGEADVLLFFTTERERLEAAVPDLRDRMKPASGLWIAWPKKSSDVESDLGQMEVMETVMDVDPQLVDNKVCAIDETWSGLRFVIRTEHR